MGFDEDTFRACDESLGDEPRCRLMGKGLFVRRKLISIRIPSRSSTARENVQIRSRRARLHQAIKLLWLFTVPAYTCLEHRGGIHARKPHRPTCGKNAEFVLV